MSYNKNKIYGPTRFFTFLFGFTLIAGMVTITYNLYKRNIDDMTKQTCLDGASHEVQVSDTVRQIFPVNEHTVMIVTASESGSTNTIIYDHCQNKILRQFNINVPGAVVME